MFKLMFILISFVIVLVGHCWPRTISNHHLVVLSRCTRHHLGNQKTSFLLHKIYVHSLDTRCDFFLNVRYMIVPIQNLFKMSNNGYVYCVCVCVCWLVVASNAAAVVVVVLVFMPSLLTIVCLQMGEIDRYACENVNKLLVGNKCDLRDEKRVDSRVAQVSETTHATARALSLTPLLFAAAVFVGICRPGRSAVY